MTKKDYELIAKAIRRTKLDVWTAQPDFLTTLSVLVDELSEALAFDNDRFDVDRFKSACLTTTERHSKI